MLSPLGYQSQPICLLITSYFSVTQTVYPQKWVQVWVMIKASPCFLIICLHFCTCSCFMWLKGCCVQGQRTQPCKRRISTEMQTNETTLLNGRNLLVSLLHLDLKGRSDTYGMTRSSSSQKMIDCCPSITRNNAFNMASMLSLWHANGLF